MMNQNINSLSSLFSDWHQTAIDNTMYSVVLAVFTAMVIGLLSVLWFLRSLNSLQTQLAENQLNREQLIGERDELLSVQQKNTQRVTAVEQKNAQLQASLKQAEQRQTQILDEKTAKIANIQTILTEKTAVIEELQAQLEQQKKLQSQSSINQTLLAETQQEASQLANELNTATQQIRRLESDLGDKNEQIIQFEKCAQINADKLAELELQIENQKHDAEARERQEQLVIGKTAELERIIQHYEQQMAKVNEKLESFFPASQAENNLSSEYVSAPAKVFNSIKNIFSSAAQVETSEKDQLNTDEIQTEDVWEQHQLYIDRLINQISSQAENAENDDQSAIIERLHETINKHENHIARLQDKLDARTPVIEDENLNVQNV